MYTLEKLMLLLKRGGTVTFEQMAHELDTTPALVAELIGYLERAGRLKPMGADCGQVCAGCALARDCQRIDRRSIWQVVS